MLLTRSTLITKLVASSLLLASLSWQAAFAQSNGAVTDDNFDVELIVDGLPKSWSLALSPDNEIFVTDRSGGIIVFDQQWNKKSYTTSINDVFSEGQGGFLDLTFHPDFLSNGWIYLSYSGGNSDSNRLKVVRLLFYLTRVC